MTTLFEYPRNAAFGRVLPKKKVYEHANLSTSIKDHFIRQVEQIIWRFKLAPETINIKSTTSVPEIQIFEITIKNGELKTDVLHCIDRAVPYPILFELRFDGKVKSVASYKRPSETDSARWVLSEYFTSDWIPCDEPRSPLPVVFDLESLYDRLLSPLMPFPPRPAEGLQARVERMESIRLLKRELERCEARLRKEKQFNLKVAINAELRGLRQKLEELVQ